MPRYPLLRRAVALLLTGLISVQPVAAQVGRAAGVRPIQGLVSAPVLVLGGPSLTGPSLALPTLPPSSALLPALSPALALPGVALQAAPSRAIVAAAPVSALAFLRTRGAASTGSAPVGVPAAAAPSSVEASAARASEIFDAAGAREALESAAQDDYSVTVLARRTDAGRQLVVLLGEGHVKSAETAQAGRRVLDRFKDYALEGYDTNSSFAGRLFWWYETKARAVTTATLPGGTDAGSSIKEARRLVAADPSLRRYDLESGHKPGLAEKLGLLSPFVKMAVPLVLLGSLLAVPFVGGAATVLAAAGISAGYVGLGAALPRTWLNGRALGVLFPLETGILRGRDKTMARAVSAIADAPATDPILAIIGRGHAPGMAKILARKYGFQATTLDALQDESLPGPPPARLLTPVVRAALSNFAKRIAFAAGLGALTLAAWGGVSAVAVALGYAAHSSYQLVFMTGENFIGQIVMCVVLAPFIEESLFRAGLFDGLRRGLLRMHAPGVAAAVAAAVVSAVIFTVFHEMTDPLFFGLHVFGALLLALAYRRAGLAGSTLAHMINNAGFILSGSALVLSPSVVVAAAVVAAVWGALLLAGKLTVKPQAGWVMGSIWEADWGTAEPPAPPAPKPSRWGRIAALTIDYYLLAAWFLPKKAAIRAFLGRHMASFDPEEMDRRIAEAPPLLDARQFKRYWKEGRYLKAYQGFWSGWNPLTRPLTREVYAALGGSRHPMRATLGTFVYSGLFIHGLNPLAWPFFLALGLLGMGHAVLAAVAWQLVVYAALALPILWLQATGTRR